jgi:EAL domain-containing protein (putative c-di-GMP-specific phosphodiesterase class I)/GGDEF domain-containing protein
MSLTRQLWIVIGVLITLTFVSGFLVSGFSARNYYVEQLTVKNIDNAASLALSLSQTDKDPVTVELMISAQFDTGHYQRILLEGPNGEVVVRRVREGEVAEAPEWFAVLINFQIPPGIAQIQDGWRQYGTIYVESESAYALAALWRTTYQLFYWFLGIALVCGLIATAVLRRISQPLQAVVAQAEAIGERRFITSTEPGTLEFKRVVRAMNTLTNRVRSMLENEARRLDEIRRQSQLDPATGVANRDQFFRQLDARLSLEDASTCDVFVLLRITGLEALNARMGRAAADRWIKNMVDAIEAELSQRSDIYSNYAMGRLNGSDFAVLAQDCEFVSDLADAILRVTRQQIENQHLGDVYPVALACSGYRPGEQHSHLMSRMDDLLASVEQSAGERLALSEQPIGEPLFPDLDAWRRALITALETRAVSFVCYPVVTAAGKLFHEEAMLRVRHRDRLLAAGAVIGWARRLQLLPKLDLHVLDGVLNALSEDAERHLAVNLSMDSVRKFASHLAIFNTIAAHEFAVTSRLSLEVNEQFAVQHPEELASLAIELKRHGVRVGLQSAGKNIAAVAGLEKLGLDYMKVDAALIQNQDADMISLLRGLCKLGRSLGLVMIAEGVLSDTDQPALEDMGFDAFTGPGIRTD